MQRSFVGASKAGGRDDGLLARAAAEVAALRQRQDDGAGGDRLLPQGGHRARAQHGRPRRGRGGAGADVFGARAASA